MSDMTPRPFTGSLLERAAELYGLEPRLSPPTIAVPVFEPERAAPVVPEPAEAAPPSVAHTVAHRRVQIDRVRLAERGFLLPGAPITALAEEFRLVKRQLLLTAATLKGAPARMILICSANPNEGKTFTAINLALSMAAEKDVEVLLVDADFAKPDVLATLGLADSPGLLDALANADVDLESCIVATDVPNLSILPSGARSSSDTELLASARTTQLLTRLGTADPRRIILFDSPPALAASPASVLAGQVGQVMLVVRADRTSEGDLKEAIALLDGCERISLVLNSVAIATGGRRFGTYYGVEPVQ